MSILFGALPPANLVLAKETQEKLHTTAVAVDLTHLCVAPTRETPVILDSDPFAAISFLPTIVHTIADLAFVTILRQAIGNPT